MDAEDAVEVATLQFRQGVLRDKAAEAHACVARSAEDLAIVRATLATETGELRRETDEAAEDVNTEMALLLADVESTLAARLAALGEGGDPDAIELAQLEADEERAVVEEQRLLALQGIHAEYEAGVQELQTWVAGEEARLMGVETSARDMATAADAERTVIDAQLQQTAAEQRERVAAAGGGRDRLAADEAAALEEAFRMQAEEEAEAERQA